MYGLVVEGWEGKGRHTPRITNSSVELPLGFRNFVREAVCVSVVLFTISNRYTPVVIYDGRTIWRIPHSWRQRCRWRWLEGASVVGGFVAAVLAFLAVFLVAFEP